MYIFNNKLIAAVEPVELTMALEAEKQEMPDFSLGGSSEEFEEEKPSDAQNDDWDDDSEEEETEEGISVIMKTEKNNY